LHHPKYGERSKNLVQKEGNPEVTSSRQHGEEEGMEHRESSEKLERSGKECRRPKYED